MLRENTETKVNNATEQQNIIKNSQINDVWTFLKCLKQLLFDSLSNRLKLLHMAQSGELRNTLILALLR